MRWPDWLLVVVTLVAALLGACRQPAVAARFPHRLHLTGLDCGSSGKPACLSCNSCHAPSGHDRAQKLPEGALCESCHQKDAARVLPVLAASRPRQNGKIRIDHDLHLAMPGIGGQCVPCHAGVVRPGQATLPPMSQCFTCHEHQAEWDRGQCSPCHAPHELSRLLPQTFLRHDSAFARHHGELATQNAALCSSCHTEQECQACHDTSQALGVEARRPERLDSRQVHRADFITRHALEARSQPARCASCHEPQTCDSCHRASGVSGALPDARNPHPPGWLLATSSNFHGSAARREIATCAGCHDQGPATNCIRCHQVGAFGGNPHPPGFDSRQSLSSEMCRYCHG